MDTWPNLYRPPKDYKPPSQNNIKLNQNDYDEKSSNFWISKD